MKYTTYKSYDPFPELVVTHKKWWSQWFSGFYYDRYRFWNWPTINIEPSDTRTQFQYDVLFDHEVNHHIYFDYISDKERKTWEKIYGLMWDNDFVRDYAKQNPDEAFADTLSFYENWMDIPDTPIWTLTAVYAHLKLKKYKSQDEQTMKELKRRRPELIQRVKKHFWERLK